MTRLLLPILLCLTGFSALAQNIHPQDALKIIDNAPAELRGFLFELHTEKRLRSDPTQCPADLYLPASTPPTHTLWDCNAEFRNQCLTNCLAGDPDECFSLGYQFEVTTPFEGSDLIVLPLYRRACVLGDSNACVNLAAANSADSQPLFDAECRMQTYELDCENGGPWGCSMLAFEYLHGNEIIRADREYAKDLNNRACDLAPDNHEACWRNTNQ